MSGPKVFDTGFTVVYEPEGPDSGPPLADIVFIHGLQGHPYRTWTHESSTNQGGKSLSPSEPTESVPSSRRPLGKRILGFAARLRKKQNVGQSSISTFWPADLLPEYCPRARILVWGYDTRVSRPLGNAVNKSNIFTQGKDLLFAFHREREMNRPVIFVAHSLGGIVLKEALTASYTFGEADMENVAKSTKAVIFMGTPHRGSQDMAGVGEVARRVASAFMFDTSRVMLDSLGLKNSDLERCQDSFSRVWRNVGFTIKTFQEGLPFTGVNFGFLNEKVVPDFSSLLGDPREHAESLQANHMEMCRFWGRDDPNYRKVEPELKRIYQSAVQAGSGSTPESQLRSEWYRRFDSEDGYTDFLRKYREARSRLHFSELGQREQWIEPALQDTCLRILNSEQYQKWQERRDFAQHHGLLWIKGKPGSGKSTLMKEAVQQARTFQTSHRQQVISFFFNARGHEPERATAGFFRALLYQLLPVYRKGTHQFVEFCNRKQTENEELVWNSPALKNNLGAILTERCGVKTIIFVDALDECDGDGPREIIQFLREVSLDAASAGVELNICMSSRHYPTITVANHLEIVSEAYNGADIALFVHRKLSMTIGGSSGPDTEHWIQIKDEIIKRASGIFLWAKLVLDVLLAEYDEVKGFSFLKSRLDSVPWALRDLYTQILQEIPHDERERTVKFFSWVLLAARPIQLREWYQLLGFVSDSPPNSLAEWKTSEDAIENDDQLQRRVQRISRGLVQMQKHDQTDGDKVANDEDESMHAAPGSLDLSSEGTGTLQLIHESVQEFFLHSGGLNLLFPSAARSPIGDAHASILTTCFDYLAIKDLDTLIYGRMDARGLGDSDSCKSAPVRPLVREQLIRRRQSGGSMRSMRSIHSSVSSVGSSASNYAPRQATSSQQPTVTLQPTATLQPTSAIQIQYLHYLHDSAVPSDTLDPPSSRTVARDPVRFQELLDLTLSHSGEFSSEAFDMASIAQSVQSKAEVLPGIPCLLYYASETIIHHAVSAEKEGSDPSRLVKHLENGKFWTRWVSLRDDIPLDTGLLHFAAEHGLHSWASYLLKIGTNANMKGGKYRYPLVAAVRKEDEQMIRLLLRNGSLIQPADGGTQGVLHRLAAFGKHVLLAAIFDECRQQGTPIHIDAQDLYGWTPLHLAASLADKRTVEVLVEWGASVNIPDRSGLTPLYFAQNRKDINLEVTRYLKGKGADDGYNRSTSRSWDT